MHPALTTMWDLTGKTALVTGASKGLGQAMALTLAQAGADVVLSARSASELEESAQWIGAQTQTQAPGPGKVAWIAADVAVRDEAERLARESLRLFGKIDILINNAGINIVAPIEHVADADWDRVLAINLHAPMILCRHLVPPMKERHWGRIINISSIFGRVSRAERNAYSTSKAGLLGLTRSMALELAPHGVTVNALLPGPFETALTKRLHPSPEQQRWFTDRVPMARWGQPEELAGPLLLLASHAGAYMTGVELPIDGGWLTQ